MATKELRTILVLAGGPGAERDVSLKSGRAIAAGLREAGYEVIEGDARADDLSSLDQPGIDLVFPIIHGTFGEDGQLQEILDARGLPYVGSGAAASRTAMDKEATRKVFASCGIPVARGLLMAAQTPPDEVLRLLTGFVADVGLPAVVKPNREGSSVGVTIAETLDRAYEAACAVVAAYGECLIEEFVAGRELTAGILVERALPLIEIKSAEGFYDYEAKYLKNDTRYIVNPELPPDTVTAIQSSALQTFRAMGCLDLGRIDFIVRPDERFIALEVNTLPGFTDHSLVPMAAGSLGMSMRDICDEIVKSAWRRAK